MNTNRITRWACAAIAATAFGCGDAQDDVDTAGDEIELGTAEQGITTATTLGSGVNVRGIGVSALNGVPGSQARPNQSTNYLVPGQKSWSVYTSGFSSADDALVRTAAQNGGADITNNGTGYQYVFPSSTSNASVKIVKVPDDGGTGKSTINLFFSVVCQTAGFLSESPTVNANFTKISTAHDACVIGVKEDKVKRLISGTTAQARVRRHGMAWALAGIGGLGETSTVDSCNMTSRSVNESATKSCLPDGQDCLGNFLSNVAVGNYAIDSVNHCTALPSGY